MKTKGFPCWSYVLVDEDKLLAFKAKIITGKLDVTEYGTVLYSGWGQGPPEDIVHKLDLRFLLYNNLSHVCNINMLLVCYNWHLILNTWYPNRYEVDSTFT